MAGSDGDLAANKASILELQTGTRELIQWKKDHLADVAQYESKIAELEGELQLAQSGATHGKVPPGVLHRRSYFYVGGDYVPQNSSQVAHGQMYVEHLVPEKVTQQYPLVMIHGHGMTGTNFLNTPDGRVGWGDHFMSEGFEVSRTR